MVDTPTVDANQRDPNIEHICTVLESTLLVIKQIFHDQSGTTKPGQWSESPCHRSINFVLSGEHPNGCCTHPDSLAVLLKGRPHVVPVLLVILLHLNVTMANK